MDNINNPALSKKIELLDQEISQLIKPSKKSAPLQELSLIYKMLDVCAQQLMQTKKITRHKAVELAYQDFYDEIARNDQLEKNLGNENIKQQYELLKEAKTFLLSKEQ